MWANVNPRQSECVFSKVVVVASWVVWWWVVLGIYLILDFGFGGRTHGFLYRMYTTWWMGTEQTFRWGMAITKQVILWNKQLGYWASLCPNIVPQKRVRENLAAHNPIDKLRSRWWWICMLYICNYVFLGKMSNRLIRLTNQPLPGSNRWPLVS